MVCFFCKDCGSQLVKRLVRQKEKEYIYYICSKYNKGNSCTRHSIKRETLINVVSETIKSYIEFNEKLYSKIKYVDLSKDLTDRYIPVLKREKVMVEKLISSLYTDLKKNIISSEEFKLFRESYIKKQKELNDSIEYRLKKQEDTRFKLNQNHQWIIDINKYKNISKIDRLSVVMLIDKIFVCEDKTIDIRFNHAEELSLLEEITKKSRTINSDPENKSYCEDNSKAGREVCCG